MTVRSKIRSGAAVAAATALAFTLMPAGAASAHGYVSDPPSRQAQCAAGVVQCGPIQWEPQSVEGPKGLMECAGGNAAFSELNDDNYGWDVTPIGTTANFEWTITAAHASAEWEYFIDGQLVASFDDGGARPPWNFTHQVDLSNYPGEQTVLARWNVADTANAFYACIDVNVGAL
ncbi:MULTISPECIES: lytic polysaccharide monooxygenase auxiliary activity family 9 protein [Nocardiopsis]|uniref:Chitin-binding protein n=1 Tax=Nocardiopsis alba TaxID=53437 RepID=A0A7K2IS49_9ACTN|nr:MULTISPECIES: lytic polysaccharide monooxygenase auxiliary activity family 9 protein [Nocardiopsis]MEC3895805.1 lytic polysaccharide monooxygenase auxiliary activity family 9 protein [Nocardiopsis sp. LDBS1602]MYR32812.1 chitin-binding protein [Nocardiopsis alba]